ncbi:MAG: hypothetical protein WCQ00_00085 [bacterium]
MEKEKKIEKYNDWNSKKQSIQFAEHYQNQVMYFREGDVWWCSVGINVGEESFGKGDVFRRPILVIKKLSSSLCIGLPMTYKQKKVHGFQTSD